MAGRFLPVFAGGRLIQALAGCPVAIPIRRIRLQKGKGLLGNSQMAISDIACETEFTHPYYFSRSFFKEFGALLINAYK